MNKQKRLCYPQDSSISYVSATARKSRCPQTWTERAQFIAAIATTIGSTFVGLYNGYALWQLVSQSRAASPPQVQPVKPDELREELKQVASTPTEPAGKDVMMQ